ncbi:hypothetical protein SESBI_36438 [Sesbania bispinosa]|nr:hypothetical protein SESBI_36438 [Sesbania bispinosa]
MPQRMELAVVRGVVAATARDSSNGWSAMQQRGLMALAETGLHLVRVGFCYRR